MQLILAIDSDRRQADELASLVTRRLAGVELIQATSAGEALQALGERVPDLILTSPLLSPFDDGVLAEYLRELGAAAAHVQALRIPVLGATPKPTASSLFSFGRKKRPEAAPHGCDPNFFADEISVYLARAAEEQQAAAESQMEAHLHEVQEVQAFTAPDPDVTPTYVPAYAPEPYVSPYDEVDRSAFELPAATEDVVPIYVGPAPSDAASNHLRSEGEQFERAEAGSSESQPFAYQVPHTLESIDPGIDVDLADASVTQPVVVPLNETAVGIAPLAASDDQVDADLFVLDAASISDQPVFELNQAEPVEAESPIAVYSLDEPYLIEPVETEIDTPPAVALHGPAQDQEEPSTPVPLEGDVSDLQLNVAGARAESDVPVIELIAEEPVPAPEVEPPSPPPYRVEPSHVRVKSRSTVAFEAALAAIRRAWGKPRKSQPPAQPEQAVVEPMAVAIDTTAGPVDPIPADPEPQFFDTAPAVPIEVVDEGSLTALEEPAAQNESDAPAVVELPVYAEPVVAYADPVFDDDVPTEATVLAADAVPVLHDERESTVLAKETERSEVAIDLPVASDAIIAPTAAPAATEKPVSPALVERLIRAVLTKEPITSVLSDCPATPAADEQAVTPRPVEAAAPVPLVEPVLATAPETTVSTPPAPPPLFAPVETIASWGQDPVVEPTPTIAPLPVTPPISTSAAETTMPAPIEEPILSAPAYESLPTYEAATPEWAQSTEASAFVEPEMATIEPPVAPALLEELSIDDGIPDAATRAALEVDLTRDINALEEEDFVQGIAEADAAQTAAAGRVAATGPPAPAPQQVTVPDDDVYELDASPGFHDLDSEIAAAAPPRQLRESLPKIVPEEPEPVQARTDARRSDKPKKKTEKRKAPAPKPRTPSNRPVQDEWGLFDPNRCGFAALVDKLNEVTEEEDPKANQTTVRVISYR